MAGSTEGDVETLEEIETQDCSAGESPDHREELLRKPL